MMESTSGRPSHMMGFSDAVQNVLMNNYVNSDGRASRSEYWWFYLFTTIVTIITTMIDVTVFGVPFESYGPVYTLAILAMLLPSLCVAVRRLHDLGKSGWWLLIVFTIIGIIPLFIFMIMEGEEQPNQYGEVPTNTIEQSGNIHTNY
jgi:uncharacterized membrane protein YhaH (DUF805 family)